MLANMTPVLEPGEFVFCTTRDADVLSRALPLAEGWIKEEEGTTLILARADAAAFSFDTAMPMRRIVLTVFSALDGVGLTAAVAGALAANGIPCNMVAAFHHDHVFVPAAMAERAIAVLRDVQKRA
ncbi:ACT domain-containing protein [Nordella sp. HKS 07]|nr:ACT domain-containing protein [Nordella sp. HKS 07]